MIKGVLVAFGIMVVSALIPVAHFVLVPASPFIGGYFGINFADSHAGNYAVKGLIFGCLVAVVALVGSGLVVGILMAIADFSGRIITLMWIFVVVFTLYSGSMSALGAMFSSLRSGG